MQRTAKSIRPDIPTFDRTIKIYSIEKPLIWGDATNSQDAGEFRPIPSAVAFIPLQFVLTRIWTPTNKRPHSVQIDCRLGLPLVDVYSNRTDKFFARVIGLRC